MLVGALVVFIIAAAFPRKTAGSQYADIVGQTHAQLALEPNMLEHGDSHPAMNEAARKTRFLDILLGKIDLMEESPVTSQIAKEVSDALARSLRESESKRVILDAIERETIEDSVQNLYFSEFHELFSKRFGNPLIYDGPAPGAVTASDIRTDPRIAKLLNIACCGTEEERSALLAAVKQHYDAHAFGEQLRAETGLPPFVSGTPASALPLIVAELDRRGEQLGLLMRMSHDYINGEYLATASNLDPLAVGHGVGTLAADAIATGIETVLYNLYYTYHAENSPESAPPALIEYIELRNTLQMHAAAAPPIFDDIREQAFAAINKITIDELTIMELLDLMPLNIQREEILILYPDWYIPSDNAWMIIGIGERINESLSGSH